MIIKVVIHYEGGNGPDFYPCEIDTVDTQGRGIIHLTIAQTLFEATEYGDGFISSFDETDAAFKYLDWDKLTQDCSPLTNSKAMPIAQALDYVAAHRGRELISICSEYPVRIRMMPGKSTVEILERDIGRWEEWQTVGSLWHLQFLVYTPAKEESPAE